MRGMSELSIIYVGHLIIVVYTDAKANRSLHCEGRGPAIAKL